jgi:hypothetical protein
MGYTTTIRSRRQRIVCALDVGTSKVCCLIAKTSPVPDWFEGKGDAMQFEVLGFDHTRAEGLKAGMIAHLDSAEACIRSAVDAAERMAGVTIEDVHVSVTCGRLKSETFSASVALPSGVVREDDVMRLLAGGRQYAGRDKRSVLHALPLSYRIDEKLAREGIRLMLKKEVDVEVIGEAASRLYADAQALLKKITDEKWLTPRGVIGIWPANTTADDTVTIESPLPITLEFLRQQSKKASGQSNTSLSDFIAPASTGKTDYIGAFSVTIQGIEKHINRFTAELDDYNKILLQALADRLAEAFAEMLHKKVRTEYWGYEKSENLSNEQLIKEEYSGIRPAPGYPACPDHTEKYKLFHLLGGEKTTGITLTESLAMYPASSVSGWYFANPESKYFGIGKINKDQVEDYAARKNMEITEVERWLRPVLDYEV